MLTKFFRSAPQLITAIALAGCSLSPTASPPETGGQALRTVGLRTTVGTTTPPQSCPTVPGGTGLLSDGDFSEAPQPSSWTDYTKPQRFAPDWRVSRQSIDFNGDYFEAPYGLCSVDLDGNPGVGAISHKPVTTAASDQYTVTFYLSANGFCGSGYPGPNKKMEVVAAGQHQLYKWDVNTQGDAESGNWLQESWSFTATASTTTLEFKSKDASGSYCGAVVAGITLAQNGAR